MKAGVKRAAIFGSFARGDATEESDIDLLIEFKGKEKSLLDLAALKIKLEESLGRNVDLLIILYILYFETASYQSK